MQKKQKNFRKRRFECEDDAELNKSDDEEERRWVSTPLQFAIDVLGFLYSPAYGNGRILRLALEEVKFLQKQRERKLGIAAVTAVQSGGSVAKLSGEKVDADGEKEDLVLQDTFAQETAVMVEDPNM